MGSTLILDVFAIATDKEYEHFYLIVDSFSQCGQVGLGIFGTPNLIDDLPYSGPLKVKEGPVEAIKV